MKSMGVRVALFSAYFLFAILLVVLFAGGSYVQWFPLRGLASPGIEAMGWWDQLVDYVWHLALPLTALLVGSFATLTMLTAEDFGTLVFSDDFERNESQELKDEPGNGWNTSSNWSAKDNKEVDLRDGTLHIYIHAEANHAVDVGHAFPAACVRAADTVPGTAARPRPSARRTAPSPRTPRPTPCAAAPRGT